MSTGKGLILPRKRCNTPTANFDRNLDAAHLRSVSSSYILTLVSTSIGSQSMHVLDLQCVI